MVDVDPSLALDSRTGLPDTLRELIEKFPRETWSEHQNFGDLVQFWLERHVMFRRLLDAMIRDTETLVDRTLDPHSFAHRFSRYANLFVNELHTHHTVEDNHYFPMLLSHESSLQRGFDILDKDHHALDGLLNSFTGSANSVLTDIDNPQRSKAEILRQELGSLNALINRHLEDEEELIVPIILRHGIDH